MPKKSKTTKKNKKSQKKSDKLNIEYEGGREPFSYYEEDLNNVNTESMCSYDRKIRKHNGDRTIVEKSCFTEREVYELGESLNAKYKRNIRFKNMQPYNALTSIRKNIERVCKNDVCIAKVLGDLDLVHKVFKTRGPDEQYGWLSNFELNDFMKQVEVVYGDFVLIDVTVRDYKKYMGFEINYTSIPHLYQNYKKRRFAVIFNTGTLESRGIHWVCVFVDLKNKKNPTIEYVNSLGRGPENEFKEYISDITNSIGKKLGIKVNHILKAPAYQTKNSECGVFVAHYIVSRLQGDTFESYMKHPPNDDEVNSFRFSLFRNIPRGITYNQNIDPIFKALRNNKKINNS